MPPLKARKTTSCKSSPLKKESFLSDRLKCPFISAPENYTKVSQITWKWKLQTKSFQTGQNLSLG